MRKIRRNMFKIEQGNSKIRKAWRSYQVGKYSVDGYCKLYNKNNRNKITPNTVYDI
jgi:hypothetical protein